MHPLGQTFIKKLKYDRIHFRKEVFFLMASKGQKFKNYGNSANIKVAILEEYKLKRNIKELAERYNIPEGTIKTWTSKLNHPELYLNQGQKRGKPKEKNLTKEDYKERYEILKKYQAFLKAQRKKK